MTKAQYKQAHGIARATIKTGLGSKVVSALQAIGMEWGDATHFMSHVARAQKTEFRTLGTQERANIRYNTTKAERKQKALARINYYYGK